MLISTSRPSVLVAWLLSFSYLLYLVCSSILRKRSQKVFKKANACYDGPVHRPWDQISSLDFKFKLIKAMESWVSLDLFESFFKSYGPTWHMKTLLRQTVFTNEPENIQTVLALKFDDYSVGPARTALRPLLGNSFSVVDGPAWAHGRALVRPIFAKAIISEVERFEPHVRAFLNRLPSQGETVDISPLFFNYTMDVSTELLFGESTCYLSREDPVPIEDDFAHNADIAANDMLRTGQIGLVYRLFMRPAEAKLAITRCQKYADRYVKATLLNCAQEKSQDLETKEDTTSKFSSNYNFLTEMATQTSDPILMRDTALQMLFGGQETTATALTNLFFHLSRHANVLRKLVDEIATLDGAAPSYAWLHNATYLRWCLNESMRLTPTVPLLAPREANKDTVLPRGGGVDGEKPLFVAKGTRIMSVLASTYRRKEIFGDDVDIFRPERWDGLRPGWGFVSFSGGPRVCVGQQFALTEAYYLIVRLLQQYPRIECRDPEENFIEKISVTMVSRNGAKVGLYKE